MKRGAFFIGMIVVIIAAIYLIDKNKFEQNPVVQELRYGYVYVNDEQILPKYPDGSYSVKGFLADKDKFTNQTLAIKGIVAFKYKCLPCAAGTTSCRSCGVNHIILADASLTFTPEESSLSSAIVNEKGLLINFGGINQEQRSEYQSLRPGEEITINVSYYTSVPAVYRSATVGQNGFFIYNSLTRR
jgi:hypothetical protein